MREPSSIYPEYFGLRPGAPVTRKVKWWHNPSSSFRGEFASHKALGRSPFESLLERDFQTILCADYRIREYAVQPLVLTYWWGHDRIKSTYTPDFVAVDVDGRILIIEVKACCFRAQQYWRYREPYIREACALDHGVQFLPFTEEQIRVQPRLANFEIMLRHRPPPLDPKAEMLARDALRTLNSESTIGEVCSLRSLPSAPGTDRIYSALMRLALSGEISLDISRPFSRSTRVTIGRPT
jgi:hypothetical protein